MAKAKTTKICLRCGSKFLQRQTINGAARNFSARKFCLECSPFGENNRKDLRFNDSVHKKCSHCGRMRKHEFFYRRGRGGLNCWCKDCYRNIQRDNARNLKIRCVEYKGGKCQRCGYCRCMDALEFHHRDPGEKDLRIAGQKSVKFTDRLSRELDKCDLLCSNCHREEHAESRARSSNGLGR